MNADDSGYRFIIDLLGNCDLAYAFKKKRLRHLQSASVNKEILNLRDNFERIWDKHAGLFVLRYPETSTQTHEILQGLFGESDKAMVIMHMNQSLAALEREIMDRFLLKHIANKAAQKNLSSILFDGENSLVGLARKQIPYFERYYPTMEKFNTRKISEVELSQSDLDAIQHFISRFEAIKENLSEDIHRYKQFEKDFFRLYREDATIDVVGYGEISTVMRLKKLTHIRHDIVSDESGWIWKKMPPFTAKEEVERYLWLYNEYRRILTDEIGIPVPVQTVRFFKHDQFYQVYAGQERIEAETICNALIKKIDESSARRMLKMILDKLHDVHIFNETNGAMTIGIDAQLSNWAIGSKGAKPLTITGDEDIVYIDTSSPMIRIRGVEQINPEIFIKSAASFLRPVIRKFFLQQVLDRYYDIRSVTIDIIANLYKEKRIDLIDGFIDTTNDYYSKSGIKIEAVTRKEIDSYYSNDAFIWKFYQASRKIDRFITEKILRKHYMFRIPEKIER